MSAIGQTVRDLIILRDDDNNPLLGLTSADFDTLEAYSLVTPATTADVSILEVGNGEYRASFIPTIGGDWVLHTIYGLGTLFDFREEIRTYEIAESTDVLVVFPGGGTWTYSGDLTNPSQQVRFLIQDTDGDNPQFMDAEIAYALGAAGGFTRRAAASLVERLMARYAAMADTTELDLSVRASQIYDHYKDLFLSLTNPFSSESSVMPYAGGISLSDIRANEMNRDRRPGFFDLYTRYQGRDYGGIRH